MNESDVLDLVPAQPPHRALANPKTDIFSIVASAVQNGSPIEVIERIIALRNAEEARDAEKSYNVAFAKFKAEAVKIVKNKVVSAGPLNGKTYAELFAVVNAVTPALSKHGLSASWKVTKDEPQWIEVTCTLKHNKGHSESVALGGPPDDGGAKNKIQARASTVSYLSRYTLKAILGLAEQDEDKNGDGGDAGHPLLQGFRDAAMGGTEALRKHKDEQKPDAAFWARYSKELKDAAAVADKAPA